MNQLKAGAFLNYVIIGLNALVALLYTPYMLRMLGQSEYGLYSLVASVISYLTVLDLGFGNATIRYTAKYRAEGKVKEQYELFGMFFLFYLTISAIVVLAGCWLCFNVDILFGKTLTPSELSRAQIMMFILVANLAFTFPMSIFSSIITAYERFVFPKIINIICIVLNTVVMVILLHYGYRAIAMVVVQSVFNFFSLTIQYLYCKKQLHIKILFGKIQPAFMWDISVYSFWIFLEVIMNKVYWSTGQFVLAAVSGTIAVAIFAVAIQLHSMYMQFSSAISSVFLPRITRMVATGNDHKEISNLFIRTGRIQNIIMCIILFGFFVFGKPFVVLWAGIEYEESYIIALLFFVALYVPLIQNLGISILQARNQMKFRSLLYILIAAFSLLLQIILAKLYGVIGCAIAVAGALILGQGLLMNIYYNRKQDLDIIQFWKEIIKMNIAPLVFSVVFYICVHNIGLDNWSSFLLYLIIYVVIYCVIAYYLSINKEEKQMISSIIRKIIKK